MHNRIFAFWLSTVVLMVMGCANVRNPQGGQKDDVPPVVVAASPLPFSTHFNSKTIVLTFDEYVRLNDIQNNLVISPPLTMKPKIKVRNKSVIVELQEELRPNTTYMFNFGDGIVDVNEANKAQELIYVFSTGDIIDSLMLSGMVWDNFHDVPAKNYKVLAFDNDTSVFAKKSVPLYFTRTKSDGSFVMPYMSEGEYYLYALDDQNANNRWDDGEALGIGQKKYNPLSDSLEITFHTSVPRPEKLFLNDIQTDSLGNIKFALDKFFQEVSITSLNNALSVSMYRTDDTLYAQLKGTPTIDKEKVAIHIGQYFNDTLQVLYHQDAFKRTFKLMTPDHKKIRKDDHVILRAPMPITLANKNRIELKMDSVNIDFDLLQDSVTGAYQLRADWLTGNNYELKVYPDAFTNVVGTTQDTMSYSFGVLRHEELGRLIIALNLPETLEHGRLILLDKQNTLHYEVVNVRSGEQVIDNLIPGEYFLRILDDTNQNGIYDPLDIKQLTSPERYYVYSGKINLRANWDLKIDWSLTD
ncbi:MAG TPA: Ig-like domain-containing protein [Flavobacteriales bacterium]